MSISITLEVHCFSVLYLIVYVSGDLGFPCFKWSCQFPAQEAGCLDHMRKGTISMPEQTSNVLRVPLHNGVQIKKLCMFTANSACTKVSGPFLEESHEASLLGRKVTSAFPSYKLPQTPYRMPTRKHACKWKWLNVTARVCSHSSGRMRARLRSLIEPLFGWLVCLHARGMVLRV